MNAAAEKLVLDNLRLTSYVANRFRSAGFEWDELISMCNLGLVKAAVTFRPEKGFLFSTYAMRCMTNEVLEEMRRIRHRVQTVSMEADIGHDEGRELTFADLLPCEEAGYASCDLQQVILAELDPLEKKTVWLKFAGYNQPEIGHFLGISQSYISRVIKSSRQKILGGGIADGRK